VSISANCQRTFQIGTYCAVNISATIDIYSAYGANFSQQFLEAAAEVIGRTIEDAWSGTFRDEENNVTYNVSTRVSVSVYNPASLDYSGAQNVIGLTKGSSGWGSLSHPYDSAVLPTLPGPFGLAQDTGYWNVDNLPLAAANGFEHLLGVGNKPQYAVLANPNLLNDPTNLPHTATDWDFRWGIQEVMSHVNFWLEHPSSPRPSLFGFSRSTDFSYQTTVGAHFYWWK